MNNIENINQLYHHCVVYRRLPYDLENKSGHPNGVLSGILTQKNNQFPFDYYLAIDKVNNKGANFKIVNNLTFECLLFEDDVIDDFYLKISRNVLWPIFHNLEEFIQKQDYEDAWQHFVEVNKAVAVKLSLKMAKHADVIIHDYNFVLVPYFLKKIRSDVSIAYFHHISWKNTALTKFKYQSDIIESLRNMSVIGMHTEQDVLALKHALNNAQSLKKRDAKLAPRILALPMPVNIKPITFYQKQLRATLVQERDFNNVLIISRLDYTKGIIELLKNLYYTFITKKYTPVAPLRFNFHLIETEYSSLKPYSSYKSAVQKQIFRLIDSLSRQQRSLITFNAQHKPLVGLELYTAYATSDILIAPSIADGLNLVVKEYLAVAAILKISVNLLVSKFCGVSQEMKELPIFDPFNQKEFYIKFTNLLRTGLKKDFSQCEAILRQSPADWISELQRNLSYNNINKEHT